jgi:transposase
MISQEGSMRRIGYQQPDMFSYLSPERRVRKNHPLRAVRVTTDEILEAMSPLFDAMYGENGRPSIPPKKLLRAQLLQMFYLVRSERLLMEEYRYGILSRWFVEPNLDEKVLDATSFTKNRDRLLEAAVAKEFLAQVAKRAREAGLVSDEHSAVDAMLPDTTLDRSVSFNFQPHRDSSQPEYLCPHQSFHVDKIVCTGFSGSRLAQVVDNPSLRVVEVWLTAERSAL